MKTPCAALLLCSILPAPAQGLPERPRRMERAEAAAAAPMLMRVRMNRLQESLNLPDDRAKAIAERWARFDAEFMTRARELGRLRGRFNEILLGPGTEEDKNARLKPLLEQFVDLRKQEVELKIRFEDEVRAGLSPAQQVRLIILVDDLTRQIREGIKEALKEGRPGHRFP